MCFLDLELLCHFTFSLQNHIVPPFVHVARSRISVFSKGYLGRYRDGYVATGIFIICMFIKKYKTYLERDLRTNYGQGNEGMDMLLSMNTVIFRGICNCFYDGTSLDEPLSHSQ